MKKFSDGGTKLKKYIITADNRLQPITTLANFTIESKQIPITLTSEPVCKASKELLNAATEGDLALVKKITQLGNGSTFTTDCLGASPLHIAAQHNHVPICELLLKSGFTKDLKNKLEKTPMHVAACVGNFKIVDLLINVGANINCLDMLKMTPLHWAVQYSHKEIVNLLLKSGALTELRNKFGLTPHDIAQQVDHEEIKELIQAYRGANYASTETIVIEEEDNYNEREEFVNDDRRIENQKNINSEPIIVNLCDDTEENSKNASNKDPVIIDIDNDIDEELPLITENDKFTNLRIVNGIIQSSREDSDNRLSAVQLLQEHGITMLQNNDNEENSILNAAMESGHSFVLTEVGKQVFKTVKQKQEKPVSMDRPKKILEKIITVTPEQFLALSNNSNIRKKNIHANQLNVIQQPVIRRKNRVTPFSKMIKNQNIQRPLKPKTEVQILTEKLEKAYKTIAEYKLKLKKQQEEVERYKIQLKLFTSIS